MFKIIDDNNVSINGVGYRKLGSHEIIGNRFFMMQKTVHYFNLGTDPNSFAAVLEPMRSFIKTPASDMSKEEVHSLKLELNAIYEKLTERSKLAFSNYTRPIEIASLLWLRDGESSDFDAVYSNRVKVPEMTSSTESCDFFLTSGVLYLMNTRTISESDMEKVRLVVELLRIELTRQAVIDSI